jgi:hypothetical protein
MMARACVGRDAAPLARCHCVFVTTVVASVSSSSCHTRRHTHTRAHTHTHTHTSADEQGATPNEGATPDQVSTPDRGATSAEATHDEDEYNDADWVSVSGPTVVHAGDGEWVELGSRPNSQSGGARTDG